MVAAAAPMVAIVVMASKHPPMLQQAYFAQYDYSLIGERIVYPAILEENAATWPSRDQWETEANLRCLKHSTHDYTQ